MDRYNPVFLKNLWKPRLQTKPSRIVGVPSLGQEECLALQVLHMLYNPAGDLLHGLVIA